MGSMRQLATMIRHVHEAQAFGIAEDSAMEMLVFAPFEAEAAHAGAEEESSGEAALHALQQD